ncbi:MAG: tetratricopeptide repeat protein [Rubrivivax sp.]|nr:tetratricopeptide repeat protein [Rubrivivax sp.]
MVAAHTAAAFAERMREGEVARRRGDLAGATAAVQAALALVPGQPEALRWLGEFARTGGDDTAAETWWRRSLAAHEAQPAVWNNLGNLLARTGRAEKIEEALAAFARAIALAPGYTEAHYNRARVLHRAGRAAEAASALQAALSLPGGPRASMLQLAARLHEDAGQLEDALRTLDAALREAPDKPALHHNRGVLLHRLGRHAEALAAHERALALGLGRGAGEAAAGAHYNHGNVLQALGRGEEALAAYRRAIAAEPRHRLAHYDLARLRWRLGDEPFDAELRALEAGEPASALGPGLRGHMLARAERHDDAAAAFAEALQREPAAAGFHDGLGRALSRLGRHDEALAAHARAVRWRRRTATCTHTTPRRCWPPAASTRRWPPPTVPARWRRATSTRGPSARSPGSSPATRAPAGCWTSSASCSCTTSNRRPASPTWRASVPRWPGSCTRTTTTGERRWTRRCAAARRRWATCSTCRRCRSSPPCVSASPRP